MDEREMLLVMTIVKLVTGSTPNAKKVETAYEDAIKSLEKRDRGPIPAR
jgi:hypothetical protein